jgi:hypothetical protein
VLAGGKASGIPPLGFWMVLEKSLAMLLTSVRLRDMCQIWGQTTVRDGGGSPRGCTCTYSVCRLFVCMAMGSE